MSLLSTNLIFRAIEEKDLQLIVQWRNNPDNNYYFYEHEPLSLSMQKIWYDKYLKSIDTDKIFIIDEISTSETIGMVSVYHIDYRSKKAEWGRLLLVEKARGKGYGKEIEKTIYSYVFNYLNLNKLFCEIYSFNTPVINLHEKMGCKVDGILRQHIYRHGKYQDVTTMSILKEEYDKFKLENKYD